MIQYKHLALQEGMEIEMAEQRGKNILGSPGSSGLRSIQKRKKPMPWHIVKKRGVVKDGLVQTCLRNFINDQEIILTLLGSWRFNKFPTSQCGKICTIHAEFIVWEASIDLWSKYRFNL